MGGGSSTPAITDNRHMSDSNIRKIMECPVCLEIPFPPIFQCVTGHNICKNCKPLLKECPICKEILTDKRNYAVEDMVRISTHACPHTSIGCKVELTGDLLEEHVRTCEYRPAPCPFIQESECLERFLKLNAYKDHLISVHGVKLSSRESLTQEYFLGDKLLKMQDGSRTYTIQRSDWRHLLDFDDHTFLIAMFPKDRMMYWTILCLNEENVAEKYGGEIKLITDKTRRVQLTWRIRIHSVVKGLKTQFDEELNINNVFQPSCSLIALNQFVTKDVQTRDGDSYILQVKYTLHKFKT